MPRNSVAYDDDFFAWTQEQARLLRIGRLTDADIENIAEEIESLGKRVRRELRSRAVDVLTELLKWQFQPAFRCGSWKIKINSQRREVVDLIEESPTLRPEIRDELSRIYQNALAEAVAGTGFLKSSFPLICPYTPEQILSEDFLPE
jgi:hypothetical protein